MRWMIESTPGFWILMFVILPAPVWLPAVFAAYAIGRKRFSLRMLLALLTAEEQALGLGAAILVAAWQRRFKAKLNFVRKHLGVWGQAKRDPNEPG